VSSDIKEINGGILTPYLVHKIWGGSKLKKLKKTIPIENSQSSLPLGETWEVSCLADGASILNGVSLSQCVNACDLPYIVKFIDTSDNLSVQVHPDDEYAKINENQSGKTECWLILDADQDSGIYLGLKPDLNQHDLKTALKDQNKRSEDKNFSQLLNFYPVKTGQFFYVPAGTIHAIGKNVTLVEIQQSSGVTYRVWDWNRVDENGKARKLHIKKALDVINFEYSQNTKESFLFKNDVLSCCGAKVLIEHEQFLVEVQPISKSRQELYNDSSRHWSIISLKCDVDLTYDERAVTLGRYSSFLLPIGHKVEINHSNGSFLLVK
jgi:mannose-6-phosphate isomerase